MPETDALIMTPPRLAPRPASTHKGESGHVALVAGSVGMSGAAVLAARGALRGGAGLVRVYCPCSIQAVVASAEPCVMTVGLVEVPDDPAGPRPDGAARRPLDAVRAGPQVRTPWADVLAIGPGLGLTQDVIELVGEVLSVAKPIVIDADGLNALARLHAEGQLDPAALSESGVRVLTPHPGEFARLQAAAGLTPLASDEDGPRLAAARAYAERSGAVLVLKGHRTLVCFGPAAYLNTTGNPGMATGGMGDVLTGLIAALIGQGCRPFDAACLGVWVHGRAGDLAASEVGPVGFTASDVAERLPRALAERLDSGPA